MLSDAEAEKFSTLPAFTLVVSLMSAGAVTTGFVVSRTSTWNVALPVLPCPSVALHVTGVEPKPKVDPDAGEHEVATLPSTLSLAEAEKLTVAPEFELASCVMSPGTETFGGVVSWTVIWNEFVPVSPPVFVALHVTVVDPSAKTSPELWSHVGVAAGSSLVTENETGAPEDDVASAVMLPGTVMMGAVADTGAASIAATASDASTVRATTPPRWLRPRSCTSGPQPSAEQVDDGDGAEQ